MLIKIILSSGDQLSNLQVTAYCQLLTAHFLSRWIVTLLDEVIDHSLQPHRPAVIWRIYSGNSIIHQLLYLFRQNHATTTSKNFNMGCAFLFEQVIHVFEIFIMTALITSHGDRLSILLNGGIHHFFHTAVVA